MPTRAGKIGELTPDQRNANRHTERGTGMLENSLRKFGAGRSILVDTLERMQDMGLTPHLHPGGE